MLAYVSRLLILSLALLFPISGTLQAADATSFDPRGVVLKADNSSGVPVGTIIAWPVATNPADMHKWLECNGQTINPAVYPDLAALLGARVPDLRGLFLRGHGGQSHSQNNGSTIGVTSTLHQSGPLGQVQGDAVRPVTGSLTSHYPTANVWTGANPTALVVGYNPGGWGQYGDWQYGSTWTLDTARVTPTASEIRPVNTAVRYLIKAMR